MKKHNVRVTKSLAKKELAGWIDWFNEKEISIRCHEKRGKFAIWREELPGDGKDQPDVDYPGEEEMTEF